MQRLAEQAPSPTPGNATGPSDTNSHLEPKLQRLSALVRMPTESVPLVWAALGRLDGTEIMHGSADAGAVGSTKLGSLGIRFLPEALDDVVYTVDLATGS